MTKTIEIVISPAGQARLETRGFAGSSCRDASQFMEQALGVPQSEQFTAEFHTQQTDRQLLPQRKS